ncbi:MAG: hypothetical protein AAFY60_09775 [Myxococcota bacterium]
MRLADQREDARPRIAVAQDPGSTPLASAGPQHDTPNLIAEQWLTLSELMLESTRNKVDGIDLGLFIFFGPFGLAVSIKRIEGKITPDEAHELIEGVKEQSPSEKRILALTLDTLIDARAVRPVKQSKTLDDGSTIRESARVILRGFIDETFTEHGEPSASERAASALLASVDTIRIFQNDASRELNSAAEEGRPADAENVRLTVEHVEQARTALQRVPAAVRDAALQSLREAYEAHDWPEGDGTLPALDALRELLFPQ